MKTIEYLRQYFPIFTILALLIASPSGASAENHHKEGKEKSGYERAANRNNERTDTNVRHNQKNGQRDDRNYESRGSRNEYHPEYARRSDHEQPGYYNHPAYGRVYNRFENNPIVFRNAYGVYYYSGNNFYRYRDGIGYCLSEPPRNQYYRHLPVDCIRIYLNGRVYFRSGNLFFELSPRGYVLVPPPLDIQLTLRF